MHDLIIVCGVTHDLKRVMSASFAGKLLRGSVCGGAFHRDIHGLEWQSAQEEEDVPAIASSIVSTGRRLNMNDVPATPAIAKRPKPSS